MKSFALIGVAGYFAPITKCDWDIKHADHRFSYMSMSTKLKTIDV